jgi:glutathione synthase/RimK-type ligase-like ATP-grasp enzyme
MAIKVFPYRAGSRGAKALADACGGRVLKRVGSKYRYREGDLIINWGASDCPFNGRGVANQPDAIEPASNKLKCFNLMSAVDVSVPRFWTHTDDIPDDAFPIMCRTKLQGHSGDGIVVAERRDQLVNAPLYTQYIKKKDEYRVHVIRKPGAGTSIIAVQRKAKRNGVNDANFMVRNLANGFVYVMANDQGIARGNAPAMVEEEAIKALEATGLAFGAVDVIWNEHQQKAYVLEINTAPGLEERTAQAYAEAFKEIVRG